MNEGTHILRYQSTVFALVLFFVSLLVPFGVSAMTIVPPGTTITTSTVWTLSGSPYVLRDGGQVNVMGTLTIEPGVIVKTARFGGFYVRGSLVARGTETAPIVFTSYRDDNYGGNTFGGSAGSPQAGDWGGIYFDRTASSSLSYATLLYGGLFSGRYPDTFILFLNRQAVGLNNATVSMDHMTIDQALDVGLYLNGTNTIELDHSTVSHSVGGLDVYNNAPFEMHNNSIVSTTGYALRVHDGGVIDARRNWWGDDSGPVPAGRGGAIVMGNGLPVTSSVLYDPWIGSRDPVILIPGILGSEMKTDQYTTIWPNIVLMAVNPLSTFMDILQMDDNGQSINSEVSVGKIIDKVEITSRISSHFFDFLINKFHEKDYSEGVDLLYFPYDWRLDIRENSNKLAEFIASHTAGSAKVDIVAHSMGGLLVKQYLLDHPNTQKIDTVVFVGTPHLGAPKAAKILMFGDDIDTHGLLYQNEIMKISENMSSVYELLPSRNYIDKFGSYLSDSSTALSYDGSVNFLTNQQLNSRLLNRADSFHSTVLDNMTFPSTMNVFNISGCKEPTIASIARRYYESGHEHFEYRAGYTAGDGTVPLGSSDAPDLPLQNRFYATNTSHSTMPSQDGIRELIVDLIRHPLTRPTLPGDIIQNKNICHLNGQAVSTHSPINIQVYDDAGNHTGPNPDGTIDMNVPGVSYDNFDDNKFVFLPTNSNVHYRVELEATATGTFNMRVSDVRDSIPTQTSYYNAVPIVTASRAHVDLSTDTTTDHTVVDLELDHAGANHFETIPVTSILDATATLDFVKPTTTVTLTDLSTSSTLSTWTRGPVMVSLSAADDMSGVLRTEYSLDNGLTWQMYDAPFTTLSENTSVLYRSIDLAGNMEEAKSVTVPIDTTPPEIAVSFDTSTMDYRIGGVDTLASTTVSLITTNTFEVMDMAYNSTTVSLFTASTTNNTGYFTRILQVNSFQKNSGETQMPIKNQLFTQWQLSPTGTLLWLQEAVQVKNGFYIIAKYNFQTEDTILWRKNPDGSIDEIQKHIGLYLPILQSNQLNFIYY